MPTIWDEIRDKKNQAKNRRDLERFPRAVEILRSAIALAEQNLGTNSDLKGRMDEELSDCYGLLGGVYRRWALKEPENRTRYLADSIRSYDRSWEHEKSGQQTANSYGMVNRIVSRLLLMPGSLATNSETNFGNGVEPLRVPKALEDAAGALGRQLAGPRKGDCWAAADLSLVNLLLNRERPQDAYTRFRELTPPDYVYKSVLDVLGPLQKLDWQLPDRDLAGDLENAVNRLKEWSLESRSVSSAK